MWLKRKPSPTLRHAASKVHQNNKKDLGQNEGLHQGLVNLDFDDNKIRFETNDYILSVIRQNDFQSDNHKDKSSQREFIKKKKTSKRSVFQDPSFIRSLCKVVGA